MMKIFLIHLLIWLALSVAYFFAAEPITVYLFPGIHGVNRWLDVLEVGLVLIFFITHLSYIICVFRSKMRKKNLKISTSR